MKWDRPNSLGKTVEAKATNRPIKIAYLVPFDDTPNTHFNLDAVFFESYTRWAGVFTLVIPTSPEKFLVDEYEEWLGQFDPDFIYSYVELDTTFVEKIDHICCPISFLSHEIHDRVDLEITWRAFLPRWDHYIQPVSSISAVLSPASYLPFPQEDRAREPTIFTQFGGQPLNRLLADNFGTAFHLYNATNPIPGFFKTLCLVQANLASNIVAGSERCFSAVEALRAIIDRKAIPISRLAMMNSSGIPRPESMAWAFAFRLFIGSTPLDRIHFWNARHLGSSWSDAPNALILEPSFFANDQLVKLLGEYLNKNNFLGHGNGPHQTEIHSTSIAENVLNGFSDVLRRHTWNSVCVSRSFNTPVVPSQKDLGERIHNYASTDTTTIKLTEDSSEIAASEPAHFIYTPPPWRSLARGQWIVELSIQRHNNLSKFSNVVDVWSLPRFRKIVRAFTDRLAKPTVDGRLALIPSIEGLALRSQPINNRSFYEINLPSDETFFRHLCLDFFQFPTDDLRQSIPRVTYKELAVSDKGQSLRGVISLFGALSSAFEIFTHKYWRSLLAAVREDSTIPLTFDCNKLRSIIPSDKETLERLKKELRLDNIGVTRKYLVANLTDTLEHLVRINVFYQVAHWRCKYCGNRNSRSFDNMKIRNQCEICATEYFAPIDIEWQYELNDFVYRSLQKHSGLPVLWALGSLQDRLHHGAFWYLPEADLYERHDDPDSKREIDILCVLDGEFLVVEAKRTATVFLNKEGSADRFVKMMRLLHPDVSILAFERYCVDGEDVGATKTRLAGVAADIRERIGPWTKLELLVGQDDVGFDKFSSELGWYGPRIRKYR